MSLCTEWDKLSFETFDALSWERWDGLTFGACGETLAFLVLALALHEGMRAIKPVGPTERLSLFAETYEVSRHKPTAHTSIEEP